MVAISEGRPKLMGLREIIESYLNHQIKLKWLQIERVMT